VRAGRTGRLLELHGGLVQELAQDPFGQRFYRLSLAVIEAVEAGAVALQLRRPDVLSAGPKGGHQRRNSGASASPYAPA
jgi:hypothetical protein